MSLPKHWTPADWEEANQATTFLSLAWVAARIIGRMSATGPVVQICGPLTTGGLGSPEKNAAALAKAMELLEDYGYHGRVFNQLPFQAMMDRILKSRQATSGYPWDLMEDFYGTIFASGLIRALFFMPDWGTSYGADWERKRGIRLNLSIGDLPPAWMTKIYREIAA